MYTGLEKLWSQTEELELTYPTNLTNKIRFTYLTNKILNVVLKKPPGVQDQVVFLQFLDP
jgi:hypothetical protein